MSNNTQSAATPVRRCVIYTRFSPRPDAATSESCDVQRAQCEEFANKKGWHIVKAYNDPDRSGSDEFREVLWSAINAIKKGDILLVAKRDRLARNVYLAESINRSIAKKGGTIVAVSGDVEGDGPEQRLVRQIVAAMAEYERQQISARTRSTMLTYQRSGRRVSAIPPYGWKVDPGDSRRIIEDGREQKGLVEIIRMWEEGMPILKMVHELDPALSRNGRWYFSLVQNIVKHLVRDGKIKGRDNLGR